MLSEHRENPPGKVGVQDGERRHGGQERVARKPIVHGSTPHRLTHRPDGL